MYIDHSSALNGICMLEDDWAQRCLGGAAPVAVRWCVSAFQPTCPVKSWAGRRLSERAGDVINGPKTACS